MTGAHTPSVADVLDAAADLLTPEGAWTQGNLAFDAKGAAVYQPSHPRAVCWCASGAILKEGKGRTDALLALSRFLNRHVPTWNDDPKRTQAEVTTAMREAANAARATSKEAQGND